MRNATAPNDTVPAASARAASASVSNTTTALAGGLRVIWRTVPNTDSTVVKARSVVSWGNFRIKMHCCTGIDARDAAAAEAVATGADARDEAMEVVFETGCMPILLTNVANAD